MPRQELGRWGRLYGSTIEDLAHFNDAQFRAAISILCRAVTAKGELPKLRPLRALHGEPEVDFLVEEGFLVVVDNSVTVKNWLIYQAPPDPTAADRQRRHRERGDNGVDNDGHGVVSRLSRVTVTPVSTSPSISSSTEDEERIETPASASYPEPGADLDALDSYYSLTGSRPWGKRVGDWIRELQTAHGVVHVVAALEVEARAGRDKLVERTAARLERMADRVATAKAKEPKPVDPLLAEQRAAYEARYGPGVAEVAAEPDLDAVAAGRAAFEALRGTLAGSHANGNGLATPVGAVLRSGSGGRVKAPADVGTAGSSLPTRGPGRSSPSSPDPAVRPTTSGPSKSPDGRESTEGDPA